ncbi:MAG: hypothetical protein GVY10_06675 [Verrucomicrobia bacterium]|jgi:Tol biopolymer transport system component/C-terminal processing protease CtpA/Prc|nr:hypothetical protein [Verrucomicrobiota bacterium]
MKPLSFVLLPALLSLGLVPPSLSAAEALWLRDVALRPDGKELAVQYAGDLFLVPSEGGMARSLVRNPAHEARPVFSPDGTKLAFASDRHGNYDVHVVDLSTETTRRLTFHSSNDLPTAFSADGARVLFRSHRLDDHRSAQFPSGVMPELYSVDLESGRVRQALTTPAENARPDATGERIIYENIKGFENPYRKHHVSAIARDIRMVDLATGEDRLLTEWRGEDRDPHFAPDGDSFYFLSERNGTLNVFRASLDGSAEPVAVTGHETHPVRSLTVAGNGEIAYSFAGRIYFKSSASAQARPLAIRIPGEAVPEPVQRRTLPKPVEEFSLSPDGKEVAFIARGDVYVASSDHGTTRRITRTTGEERDLTWHPDGGILLYAGDREGRWRLFEAKLGEGEAVFYDAVSFTEKELKTTGKDATEPRYDPEGKRIAYMSGLTELRLLDRETGADRRLLENTGLWRYSADANHFAWSPDGKYLLVDYEQQAGSDEIGLLTVDEPDGLRNLTENGFYDAGGRWVLDGKAMLWQSDRDGRRNFRGRNSELSVWLQFFDKAAHERFLLSEARLAALEEREALWEQEKEEKGEETANDADPGDRKKETEENPLVLDLDGLPYREVRLTSEAGDIALPLLSDKGDVLYYFVESEEGYDLWKRETRTGETRRLGVTGLELDRSARYVADGIQRMVFGPEEEQLFLLNGGRIQKIDTDAGKAEPIAINVEAEWDEAAERVYELDHVLRIMEKRFYRADLHGVPLADYRDHYRRFLPHIHHPADFAELLSEFLGELNVSHTGAYPRHEAESPDETATLAFYPDREDDGPGILVAEVLPEGPLAAASLEVTAGERLLALDGQPLPHIEQLHRLLNRKADQPVRLTVASTDGGQRHARVYPVSLREREEWLYNRWVRTRREATEALSGGRLGYVHIEAMNDRGYRQVYEEALRLPESVEALVVDTRFNGGGFLHDELVRFFDAQRYYRYEVQGRLRGYEPQERWAKPQILLMSESNYSNAYMVPQVFQDLDLGTLVGMPVAGTGTAVWWKNLPFSPVVFGIPQVGIRDLENDYLENKEIFPDIRVDNPPAAVARGEDAMLKAAVAEMLRQL